MFGQTDSLYSPRPILNTADKAANMFMLLALSLIASCLVSANPIPQSSQIISEAEAFKKFANVTVFVPPADWQNHGTSYGRTLLLNQNCETSNHMLATFTVGAPGLPYFPIMESKDGGNSWVEISKVYFHATATGGIILQPDLYELPRTIGKFPAGTILVSGNAIPPTFNSTNIEVLASMDKGMTWEYVSTVVSSGPPNTTNGAPCVWEPFIHSHGNQVLVHYSDQSDPSFGQKLAHRASKDMMTWGPTVNDVTFPDYNLRPGMITMDKMGNGKWITTYEVGNFPAPPASPYGVHYTVADSPTTFGNHKPQLLRAVNTKTIPSASPFVQWTPAGGPNGTVVVSDGSYAQLFLNAHFGNSNSWVEVESGKGIAYSRSLRVMPNEKQIMVFNGGLYGEASTIVSAGIYTVPGPDSKKDTISHCGA